MSTNPDQRVLLCPECFCTKERGHFPTCPRPLYVEYGQVAEVHMSAYTTGFMAGAEHVSNAATDLYRALTFYAEGLAMAGIADRGDRAREAQAAYREATGK